MQYNTKPKIVSRAKRLSKQAKDAQEDEYLLSTPFFTICLRPAIHLPTFRKSHNQQNGRVAILLVGRLLLL